MPHKILSHREKLEAISRVCARLLDNGWISKVGTGNGKIAVEYTDKGIERMTALRRMLIEEIHPGLTSEDYIGLMALLAMIHTDEPQPQDRQDEPQTDEPE